MNITKIKVVFEDNRGSIADIFYKTNINHIAIINSRAHAIRGNHYHKESTQHLFVIKGSLRYYSRDVNDNNDKIKSIIVHESEMVTTPPFEVHAMEMLEDNRCMVFTEGLRGGKDYEKDTFKVDPQLIKKK